jgi:Kef-type K+ transport system membrane component KefB
LGKSFFSYLLTIVAAFVAVFLIVNAGGAFESEEVKNVAEQIVHVSPQEQITETFSESLGHSLPMLIIQIITIIAFSRFLGLFFSRIGQPSVIGEILAGILLGPSLLGLYFPEISAAIFPVSSLDNLQFLSQIGLILFMFVIGMELDVSVLKSKARDAIFISHVSIVFPFSLGVGLAYFTFQEFAPENIRFISFALFMGISMSITAFPVLARIVQERGLTKSKLGILVITSAAIDDVTAWCLLAIVIAIVKAGAFSPAIVTIGLSLLYVLFMLLVLRPFLNRLGSIYSNRESISKGIIALVFLIMLSSAWATEVIGIHALFGAFLAGVVMPPNLNFRKILVDKLEDVALVLLLPLFFVFTGLRTQIGLLNDPSLWVTCLLVILVAIVGKFLGSALAARYVGQSWKDSLSIGALMNTRGLMELIVLNIGYDLGILSPEMFAMLVLMALVTTFTTGPMLSLINFIFKDKSSDISINTSENNETYKVLISFGLATSGRTLLRLATQMFGQNKQQVSYTAMHVTLSAEVNLMDLEEFERQSFKPILSEAQKLNLEIGKEYKTSPDLHKEVNSVVDRDAVNFLLIGAGRSLYTGSILGNIVGVTKSFSPENLLGTITGARPILPANDLIDEKAREFLLDTSCDVGVLLDRDFTGSGKLFVPIFNVEDVFLLNYAQRFADNGKSEIALCDTSGLFDSSHETKEKYDQLLAKHTDKLTLLQEKIIHKDFLDKQELMLVSYKSWKALVESKSLWLDDVPSVLIIRPSLQPE